MILSMAVADAVKDGLTAKVFDVFGLETNRREVVESLFEPRGNQEAALRRQRSDEQFEARGLGNRFRNMPPPL